MKPTHISYTGDGVDWHDSEEKAIKRLEEAISDARADAIQAGRMAVRLRLVFDNRKVRA